MQVKVGINLNIVEYKDLWFRENLWPNGVLI